MTSYATLADVQVLETVPASDEARVTRYLESAQTRLLELVPDVAGRLADGSLSAVAVRDVLVDAVTRRYGNPRGLVSESAGDYSYSLGRAATTTADGVDYSPFTAAEIARLRPAGATVGTARLSVPTYRRVPAAIDRGYRWPAAADC